MRVLHVLPKLTPGGAEHMATNLMLAQSQSMQVGVLSLYHPETEYLGDKLRRAGVHVWSLGKRSGFDGRMFLKPWQVLSDFRPNVVHTHQYVLRYLFHYTFAPGRVWIHTVHNLAQYEVPQSLQVLQNWLFRGAVTPVAIAKAVSCSLQERYKLLEVPLIYNGIPTSDFARLPASSDLRRKEGATDSDVVFLAVGRLVPQKNPSLMLRAFSELSARHSNALLWMVGDGGLRGQLELEAKKLRIESRVRFLGQRNEIPQLLAAADAFVMSSDYEGHPLAPIEAMAASKAVVATRVGGLPDIVDERTGILVPPGDATALSVAMSQLMHTPLRQQLGQAGQVKAVGLFDVKTMASKYTVLYQERMGLKHGMA